MRIVLDARVGQSDRVGMGVYVSGLAKALARQYPEHELVLLTSARLAPLSMPERPNVRIVPAAPTYQDYLARDWWEQTTLPGLLARLGADVYHAPNYTLPFLRRAPCPMVLTLYDASLFMMPAAYRARHGVRVRFLIRRSVRHADAIVFGSRHAEAEFGRLFGSALPFLRRPIYIGVPEDITAGSSNAPARFAAVRAKFDLKGPYAIAIGSINPRKNYERLIEAFARPELSGVRLVICGGVAWKTEGIHRALEAIGGRNRVILTGFVETGELRTLLQGAVMMVFPSLYEGFGIPPLEAFALGVPVCASNASSIPEVVGGAAVLFDPYSVSDMATAVARVLNDAQLRNELVLLGRARLQHFSWERCAQEHMDLYAAAGAQGAR